MLKKCFTFQNKMWTQVLKHLLKVKSLKIILSSFYHSLNKLLRAHVFSLKIAFSLALALAYYTFRGKFKKSSHLSMFLQSFRWKRNQTSAGTFFKLPKMNLPIDAFINLQLSRIVYFHRKWLLSEKKGRKTESTQEAQADQRF